MCEYKCFVKLLLTHHHQSHTIDSVHNSIEKCPAKDNLSFVTKKAKRAISYARISETQVLDYNLL